MDQLRCLGRMTLCDTEVEAAMEARIVAARKNLDFFGEHLFFVSA